MIGSRWREKDEREFEKDLDTAESYVGRKGLGWANPYIQQNPNFGYNNFHGLSPGANDRLFSSNFPLFGPNSVLNINQGHGPIGNGFVHPLTGQAQSLYQVRPGIINPKDRQGSFLDLINTSYEPFVLILAAGGAVLSFLLYQVILTMGRRRNFKSKRSTSKLGVGDNLAGSLMQGG